MFREKTTLNYYKTNILCSMLQMDEKFASAKQKYEDEIRERDQKIVKLKKQMADAFTGNSM